MAMLLKARRLCRRVVVAAEAAVHEYRRHQSRDDLLYSRSEAAIPFRDSLLYSNSKYEQQPINWGIRSVLENKINVVETFGMYHRILESGIHILIPFIVDPILASYGVAGNPIFMVIQLTETTMKDELGKITLDQMFEEKDALNESIAVYVSSHAILPLTVVGYMLKTPSIAGLQTSNTILAPPRDGRSPSIGGLSELERMAGGMPDPSFVNQLLHNPAISRQQLHNLLGSNAQFSSMLQNPELIQHLISPKTASSIISADTFEGPLVCKENIRSLQATAGNVHAAVNWPLRGPH
ncbi:hypothetical protein ZIOFF_049677 [Zingiber officinale]|uniref:Uncharacterized protein n=1 Tax=Zingiber officinale TaxID=94328 RepID=A0A8J5KQ30_ZINOF|nr:hypothetical protein ZIOFF_049677 [Zingiber officinale]